jgi:hypothetical protein
MPADLSRGIYMPVDEEEASRRCVSCPRDKSGAVSADIVSCIVFVRQKNIFAIIMLG